MTTLAEETTQALARHLDEARLARREVQPLGKTHGELALADAYAVQRAGRALRLARGERVIGFKMGLTSAAKREQMKLASPIYGYLTDRMRVADGGAFAPGAGIHPKIEPEIAFVTARELSSAVTREQAQGALAGVCAAMEILDSRYAGFKYFSLPDVVADNCSSSHFVLGTLRDPAEVDLAALRMRLFVDGRVAQEALSSAISGHPLESLVQLVSMLAEDGEALPAGSIVLAGAATAAEPLRAGLSVQLEVDGLPTVSVSAV